MFANDIILVARVDQAIAIVIQNTMEIFANQASLSIYFEKSNILDLKKCSRGREDTY